jgi:hypothetical protein
VRRHVAQVSRTSAVNARVSFEQKSVEGWDWCGWRALEREKGNCAGELKFLNQGELRTNVAWPDRRGEYCGGTNSPRWPEFTVFRATVGLPPNQFIRCIASPCHSIGMHSRDTTPLLLSVPALICLHNCLITPLFQPSARSRSSNNNSFNPYKGP